MAIHRSTSRVKFPSRTKHGARDKKAKHAHVDDPSPSAEEPAASTACPKGKKAPQRTKPRIHIFLGRNDVNSARSGNTGADITDTDQALLFLKKQIPTINDLLSCGQLRTEFRLTSTSTEEDIVPDVGLAANDDCAIVSDDDCAVVDDDCAILSDDDYDGSPPASLLMQASLYEPSEDGFEDPIEPQTSYSPSSSPPTLSQSAPLEHTPSSKSLLQTIFELFAGRKKKDKRKPSSSAPPPPTVEDDPETQDHTLPEQPKRRFPPYPPRKITIASVIPPIIHPTFTDPSTRHGYVEIKPAPNHKSIGDASVAPATFVPETVQSGFKAQSQSKSQAKSTNSDSAEEVLGSDASNASIFDREREAWRIWGEKNKTAEKLQAQRECLLARDYWIRLGEPGFEREW